MKGKMAVTVDIEDWYHIPSVTGSPFSVYRDIHDFFHNWNGRYDYLSEPTERVLDLLDEFNITATFFVVAHIANDYPGLVESIVDRGHEIACHGLHHTCKLHPKTKRALMSVKQFEDRTLRAKRILEEACKERVIGYRAPNALVGDWMLSSLERMGFRYDSSVSVNSFYNRTNLPLTAVSSSPYQPNENGALIEFPWAFWNLFGIKIPACGGPMLRFLGARVVLEGLKDSLRRSCAVFYFHPIDISREGFPKVGKGRPLYWLFKGKLVEKRIRWILNRLNHFGKICLKDILRSIS